MALQDQIHLYSIDTSAFYNNKEMKLHRELSVFYVERRDLKAKIDSLSKIVNTVSDDYPARIMLYVDIMEICESRICVINKMIKFKKEELKALLKENELVRNLRLESLNERSVVSSFTSALTRAIGAESNKITEDLIIVQTYYFEVLESIVKKGFRYKGDKYVVFTASAGQIRTKRTMFIKESVWEESEGRLTCGLTRESINKSGGVNVNKYLAYLALTNSATEPWEGFNINRAIVVEDMTTMVKCRVDHVKEEDYSIDENQKMPIEIEHTDGAGIICDNHFKDGKCRMVRLPFVKGLVVPFPIKKFIREAKANCTDKKERKSIGIVKDIYGRDWDIIKDEINVIFTKSQFKMWKYYKNEYNEDGSIKVWGWDKYKEAFVGYGCEAGECNIEPDADKFNKAKINYQMIQSITDITDKEIENLCKETNEVIHSIGSKKDVALTLLGANPENEKKNGFQMAVSLYPELLKDIHTRRLLGEVKRSYVKQGRSGKLAIDGVYTYIVPDMYAFCERLFLGEENPKGLLSDGEIFCNLYKENEKLDVLRSPHLFREHAIRNNVIDKNKAKELKRWFITNGVYTSIHDPISRILQFDVDGDQALLCADETLVRVAERNMKGVLPLYYEMKTANVEKIDEKAIYKGMVDAYKGGNIGMISNEITKVWNCGKVDDNAMKVIKLLCMENNFVID